MIAPPPLTHRAPMCVLLFFLVAGLLAGAAGAAPVINEFLTINSGAGLVDEDGDSSDWIEIFNPDAVAVDLGGYGLSDDEDNPLRWRIPAGVTLEPGEFLIVFASGKDRAVAGAELHTNFSLNGDGEHLSLADAAGVPIDSFSPEFPEQQRDISYGVGSGGGLGFLLVPTPGAANGEALAAFTSPPSFSLEHGYYQQPVVVEMSAEPGSTST